jgi:hypothetical protein
LLAALARTMTHPYPPSGGTLTVDTIITDTN